MFELVRANKRRSILLIAGFVVVVTLVGGAFGLLLGNGSAATVVALAISAAVAFGS